MAGDIIGAFACARSRGRRRHCTANVALACPEARIPAAGQGPDGAGAGVPGTCARGDSDRTARAYRNRGERAWRTFFDALCDRQSLAYTVRAFALEWTTAGMFTGYIATSPAKEAVARAGLLAEFAKLRESGVTAEELAQAQTYAVGTHAISRQSGAAVLGEVIDAWIFGKGLEDLDLYERRIRAVTTADVLRVSRAYFDPGRVAEGVVRGAGA